MLSQSFLDVLTDHLSNLYRAQSLLVGCGLPPGADLETKIFFAERGLGNFKLWC